LREANSEKFGNVDTAVAGLAQQTQALNKVLSSSQGRGNWGEKMLVDILMQAGFERGINYEMQEKLEAGGKPDFTFHLPPDRVLYLDSKFPMENYLKYFEAQDDNSRKIMKDAFIKNVEERVKELQDRDYVHQSNANALDYVLLFIPNEGVLGFIQQHKPSLIDEAVAKRVVLCSPLTLYAFLGVVRQATASFAMEQNANEVLRLLTNFGKAWGSYVKNLKEISGHFEKMQKKLKAVTTGRVFSGVNKPLREIEDLAKSRGISSDNSAMQELDAALAEADAAEADDDE
jgi:DNA recombination protein RmuC